MQYLICGRVHAVEVRYHPLFERWLTELADADEEIFGEVMALLTALEEHGRDLDDEEREESHPVVTSRYDMQNDIGQRARGRAARRRQDHPGQPVVPGACE